MPRQGPGGFPCSCGGKYKRVLRDRWEEADGVCSLIRTRRCNRKKCKLRHTTREQLFGTPREVDDAMYRHNLLIDGEKAAESADQLTFDEVLFPENENELAGVVECHEVKLSRVSVEP